MVAMHSPSAKAVPEGHAGNTRASRGESIGSCRFRTDVGAESAGSIRAVPLHAGDDAMPLERRGHGALAAFVLCWTAWACGPSGNGGGGTGAGQTGAICSSPSGCSSNLCLTFVEANDQNAPGMCSSLCTSPADCGNQGTCIAQTHLGQSVCFRTCSAAADCGQGLPCVWRSQSDSGVCSPIPSSFCSSFATQGGCLACAAASCCNQTKACAEDYACSKLVGICPGNAVCPSTLQASGNAAAQAEAACVTTNCATQCP